eukprot:Filipodium_phascolosomae@DN1807_c0_g1_i4.p1
MYCLDDTRSIVEKMQQQRTLQQQQQQQQHTDWQTERQWQRLLLQPELWPVEGNSRTRPFSEKIDEVLDFLESLPVKSEYVEDALPSIPPPLLL